VLPREKEGKRLLVILPRNLLCGDFKELKLNVFEKSTSIYMTRIKTHPKNIHFENRMKYVLGSF